jgi:hypothetical protein
MQRPTSPHSQRLRTLRRRVAAGALATFVTAWLAVAALGKNGSSTAAASSTTSSGSSGTPSRTDDGSAGGIDGGRSSGEDQSQSQDSQSGPVTTAQS